MRARFFVLGAMLAASLGACVIGPKQEDPAATGLAGDASVEDTGTSADTSVVAVPTVETGESVDGAGGAFTDAVASDAREGDALGDAPRDGADADAECQAKTWSIAGCNEPANGCQDSPDACAGISTWCGCDGVTFQGGCGFAYKPFRSAGACPDTGL